MSRPDSASAPVFHVAARLDVSPCAGPRLARRAFFGTSRVGLARVRLSRAARGVARIARVGCCTNIKTQKKTPVTPHHIRAHMCATAACMRPCEKNANQANPCCLSGGGARRARGRPATRACALPAAVFVRPSKKDGPARWSIDRSAPNQEVAPAAHML